MNEIWFYSILSVLVISLVSFVGIFTLSLKADKLKKVLIYFISFSAGALMADAFVHLLPEVIEETGSLGLQTSLYVLLGIVLFFGLEKVVHWQHCHMPIEKGHAHPFAYMNLVGDSLHNFIDGLVIAASYVVSLPAGIATTIAVLLHEIPQEIGDFGVLIHGGFSKGKALMLNFATALLSIVGAIVGLLLTNYISHIEYILVPIAAGGFIYIAGSDLIPELHKDVGIRKALLQLGTIILGILVMIALLFIE